MDRRIACILGMSSGYRYGEDYVVYDLIYQQKFQNNYRHITDKSLSSIIQI